MKLFVATPMYGGQCYGAYTDSLVRLAVECERRRIGFELSVVFNESHIDRGRNTCAHEFLKTDATHLFFIDSDISFQVDDVFELLDFNLDIVCGFYPKKCVNWKQIVEAVRLGYADKDPNLLAHFVGDMVYTPALKPSSAEPRSIYELAELHEGGTGFMLIKRGVFDKIRELHPELGYHKVGPNSEMVHCFFDAKLCDEPYRHHKSEDYAFCGLVREAGFTIWLAPWIKLTHHGYHRWIGDVEAIGRVMMKEPANAPRAA